MRGESSESMRWNVFGSVIRAHAKTKPVTIPSASAAIRSLISEHRLEHEGRADRGRHPRRGGVRAEAGDQRPEHEAEVAPEAVDADEPCTVARVAGVRDGGDQGRIHHRRAESEQR